MTVQTKKRRSRRANQYYAAQHSQYQQLYLNYGGEIFKDDRKVILDLYFSENGNSMTLKQIAGSLNCSTTKVRRAIHKGFESLSAHQQTLNKANRKMQLIIWLCCDNKYCLFLKIGLALVDSIKRDLDLAKLFVIEKLDLSLRARNALLGHGLNTLRDVIDAEIDNEMIGILNFGKTSRQEALKIIDYFLINGECIVREEPSNFLPPGDGLSRKTLTKKTVSNFKLLTAVA